MKLSIRLHFAELSIPKLIIFSTGWVLIYVIYLDNGIQQASLQPRDGAAPDDEW